MGSENTYTSRAEAYTRSQGAAEAGADDPVVRAPVDPRRQPGSVGGTSTNNPNIGVTAQYTTVSAMRGDIGDAYATDPKRYNRLVKLMKQAGYNTDGSRSSAEWYWNVVLNDASYVKDKMDPYQYLEWKARKVGASGEQGGGSGGSGGGGGYSGPTYRVDLTNEFDARALVDNALNQFLGRDATEQERQKFWQRLNKAEAANPSVATPQGVAGTVMSGGFRPEVFAEDFAKSRKDYAETQASTTMLDWMTESIMKDKTEGLM